jgi:hypothetical protein
MLLEPLFDGRDGLGRPIRPSIRPASTQFGQAREESEIADRR